MKRLLCAGSILCLATLAIAGDAPSTPNTPTRPSWCQAGYECITRSELSRATIRLIDLQEENARLRAKAKRVTWHLTCGLGIAGVVTSNFDAKLTPAGYCGIGYGF
jgi:hypothetical protein